MPSPLVKKLLEKAVSTNASDVYTVVGHTPSLRINGEIIKLDSDFKALSDKDVLEFIKSLMSTEQFKVYQEQKELDFAYSLNQARFRVNAFHQMGNPSCCLRYLESNIPSLESLNLSPIFKELAERSSGIILFSGPTGCGKSTTMSAMIDHINSNFAKHIITIEDPVEYLHPIKKSIVEQREIGRDSKSFGKAMKSALRQNPNVLLMGEMRDLESISSAITLAETGHLVFSTIHSRSSVQTINKIIDSFPGDQQSQIRQQLSESLLAVISQRLVPRQDKKGLALAIEIMIVNNAIANLIREEKTHQIESTIQTSRREGMQLIDDDLLRLVQEESISAQDAINWSSHPKGFKDKLKGLGLLD